ncbi:MAG: putative Cytosolic Protein, partial [Bacillus sp. (in: firmicutes)]|nr:putative Cytosolic Protein [Bacillus sp. (in: firmicutes)]
TGFLISRLLDGVAGGLSSGVDGVLFGDGIDVDNVKFSALLSVGMGSVKLAKGAGKVKQLLPSEGKVGTYKDLIESGSRGDNITPHHMPSAEYMKSKDIAKNDGVCMNMEQPTPGAGGRHRQTRSYGSGSDLNETPRDTLARDIIDVRKIYQNDGLYTPEMRQSLKNVIKMNKERNPNLFEKGD